MTNDMEMPHTPSDAPRNPTNALVVNSILVFTSKFRVHNHMLDSEPLSHEQIEQILDGIRDWIYKAEGTVRPIKKS